MKRKGREDRKANIFFATFAFFAFDRQRRRFFAASIRRTFPS
jgi:hypothetical protein